MIHAGIDFFKPDALLSKQKKLSVSLLSNGTWRFRLTQTRLLTLLTLLARFILSSRYNTDTESIRPQFDDQHDFTSEPQKSQSTMFKQVSRDHKKSVSITASSPSPLLPFLLYSALPFYQIISTSSHFP